MTGLQFNPSSSDPPPFLGNGPMVAIARRALQEVREDVRPGHELLDLMRWTMETHPPRLHSPEALAALSDKLDALAHRSQSSVSLLLWRLPHLQAEAAAQLVTMDPVRIGQDLLVQLAMEANL
jgi:hypothetical protein